MMTTAYQPTDREQEIRCIVTVRNQLVEVMADGSIERLAEHKEGD